MIWIPLVVLVGGVVTVAALAGAKKPSAAVPLVVPEQISARVSPVVLAFSKLAPAARASVALVRSVPPDAELAPSGAPFVRATGADVVGSTVGGLDLDGQWWAVLGDGKWHRVQPAAHDWHDAMVSAVKSYVIPALGAVLTAFGGPAGFAAAVAMNTWARVASGATITDAMLDEAMAQAKTRIEQSTYYRTAKRFAETSAGSAVVSAARAEVAGMYRTGGPTQEAALAAFDSGVALGRAARVQAIAYDRIRGALSGADLEGFNIAMAASVPLIDWAYIFGGMDAQSEVDRVLMEAAEDVDAGG